jgi:6-pyruvoyltetrahydropterin 2'-reductase
MNIRLAQKPFLSVQGEGIRTGRLTIFVRLFGCNLRCGGFFQTEPTKPETWITPILADPKSFKSLNDFPVVEYGCDTLYAIDPRYKHLAIDYDIDSLMNDITSLLPTYGGKPTWIHPNTGNAYDICFTGGEPLLNQKAIIEILSKLPSQLGPEFVQFETNGTKPISAELSDALQNFNVLFNVSPKLLNVTGEINRYNEKVLQSYLYNGYVALKFVVNDKSESFDELDEIMKNSTLQLPVYVMPVGSSFKQQSDYETINRISVMAVERGYHISGRLHCILFGNDTER